MVWVKNLIVSIRRDGIDRLYKATHGSNADYANKQCLQEVGFSYFICYMWVEVGKGLKR